MTDSWETGRASTERPHGIQTREDFGEYVLRVLADCRENGTTWENGTLERFLDGLSAIALDASGADNAQAPTWQLFAEMLAASTAYE